MEKDGERSLSSQSLGAPCFQPYLRNCTHKLQRGQLLGRTTRTFRPHRLLYSFVPGSQLFITQVTLHSYGLSDLFFQRIYLVIQKRPPFQDVFLAFGSFYTHTGLPWVPFYASSLPRLQFSGADHSPDTFHLASSFSGLLAGSHSFGVLRPKTLQVDAFFSFFVFHAQNRPSSNVAFVVNLNVVHLSRLLLCNVPLFTPSSLVLSLYTPSSLEHCHHNASYPILLLYILCPSSLSATIPSLPF